MALLMPRPPHRRQSPFEGGPHDPTGQIETWRLLTRFLIGNPTPTRRPGIPFDRWYR